MNIEQIKAAGILFTDYEVAESFVNRAFETAGKSLRIVFFDCPYYLVCSPRLADWLVKEGYELAN